MGSLGGRRGCLAGDSGAGVFAFETVNLPVSRRCSAVLMFTDSADVPDLGSASFKVSLNNLELDPA